jgi:coronin-1B/1C/6
VHENEVMRAYKTVNDSYIEPISFTVPRRAEVFQSDIYPPATGLKPAVSAAEWLAGKDGIPPKIDLESIYEGNGPAEVPADYKPPTSAPVPAPVKASSPVKEAPEPTPTQRGPPPNVSDQKTSIAAMASKFQDDEPEENDDDASSFEEISKPVQKQIPAAARAEAAPPSSPLKLVPTKTFPPKPSPQATPKSAQPPEVIPTPTTASGAAQSKGSESVETSLEEIKSLLQVQMKTINAQSDKIGQLTQEVDTLKKKVGTGTQDQSERIRQLELELEAARS